MIEALRQIRDSLTAEEPPGDDDPTEDHLRFIWHQMLVGDLTAGRPSGRWMRRLSEMGMSDRLIDLLEKDARTISYRIEAVAK